MKAENGCGEELRQGYCSFSLHLLSKGVSDLLRGKYFWGVKYYWWCLFISVAVQIKMFSELHNQNVYLQICIWNFMSVLKKDVLQCCMSNQRPSFNFIQTTCLCFWTSVSSQYVSVFSSWWVLLADKSFRKPSVHFHSSFQQCEWCDSLLGQRDYWDQASPSSMPLAQPAKPA